MPEIMTAAYLASMLVLALAEHIADAASDDAPPPRTAIRH
jgi:Spy/CpxP family protein refolding chaperone